MEMPSYLSPIKAGGAATETTFDRILELDIGGTTFRTTKNTLCSQGGFFQAMLQQGHYSESNAGRSSPIFIDRDATAFSSILSFLRSGKIFFTSEDDDIYLQKLLLEADFYQLTDLYSAIEEELESRTCPKEEKTLLKQQKVIGCSELPRHLDQGWQFVASFQGNEAPSCSFAKGSKIEAEYLDGSCSVCGTSFGVHEKFMRHVALFQPTKIVLSKDVYVSTGSSSSSSSRGGGGSTSTSTTTSTSNNNSTSSTGNPVASSLALAFDQSFG